MQIAEEFAFDEYFTTQSIEWCRNARYDRKRLVGNGELVLISDTYEAAGWGKLAYRTTMKGGANKQNPSISFCQDPRDGSYRKKYDFHRCDAAVYQRAPAISAVDQCIGFRGYVIKCPREAWSSM
ncbi:hypothetical protein M413DRAFT_355252 [Hebeloma cylindrosporum]|uniref:Uncharacterized protein n=1 Tax=Hebeloma cylindrosporum TaxID=76867 RepID=A0A0C3CK80_HEBCY|nr:hypothetical protein M413DRAFT_355252 [Hebeloma cylindrosporum h7]